MQRSAYGSWSRNTYRYCVAARRFGSTSAPAVLMALRVPTGGRVAWVTHILVDTARPNNTGLGVPLSFYRSTGILGTGLAASRIPRLDFQYPVPTTEVLTSNLSLSSTFDNQRIITMGGGATTSAATSSQMNFWKAWDRRDSIILREGQGIICVQELAADIDDDPVISFFWEEE